MIMATIQSKLKPSGEARPGSSSSASGCVQPPSFPRRQDLASRPCPSVGTHAVPSCRAEGAQDGARKAVAWSSRGSGAAAGMKIPPPSPGIRRQLSAQHHFASAFVAGIGPWASCWVFCLDAGDGELLQGGLGLWLCCTKFCPNGMGQVP